MFAETLVLFVEGIKRQCAVSRQAWIAAISEKLDIALRESEGTTEKVKAE